MSWYIFDRIIVGFYFNNAAKCRLGAILIPTYFSFWFFVVVLVLAQTLSLKRELLLSWFMV